MCGERRLAEGQLDLAARNIGAQTQTPRPNALRVVWTAAVFDHFKRAHTHAAGKLNLLANASRDCSRRAQFAVKTGHVGAHVTGLIDQHASYIPYINYAGFALALALLAANMAIMTKRRRFTRG